MSQPSVGARVRLRDGRVGEVVETSWVHTPVYRTGLIFAGPTGLVGFQRSRVELAVLLDDGETVNCKLEDVLSEAT